MVHSLIITPRGCGADILIRDILKKLDYPVAGYITVKEEQLAEEINGAPVHIYFQDSTRIPSEENLVGYCKNHHYYTIPGAFDYHIPQMTASVSNGSIFMMDEIGFMEAQEAGFCQAVLSRLDGDVPVIASVKNKDFPFLNTVRSHPKCRCFHLNENNYNQIFEEVLAHMQREIATVTIF